MTCLAKVILTLSTSEEQLEVVELLLLAFIASWLTIVFFNFSDVDQNWMTLVAFDDSTIILHLIYYLISGLIQQRSLMLQCCFECSYAIMTNSFLWLLTYFALCHCLLTELFNVNIHIFLHDTQSTSVLARFQNISTLCQMFQCSIICFNVFTTFALKFKI